MTKEIIDSAMKDLAQGAKNVYGDKLKEVILFGSCARGDFANDSDVDVMILLDIPKEEENTERERIHETIYMLDKKYGYELLFATVVESYDYFKKYVAVSPFLMNVRSEGVRYA